MASGRTSESVLEAITLFAPHGVVSESVIEVLVIVAPLVITCGNPPLAALGALYSHAFPVTGGAAPLVFAVTGGSLPPGLALNPATGVVSGVPTVSGTFPVTIMVTDFFGQVSSCGCVLVVGLPLTGLRVVLRGVKRTRIEPEPELCGCPELPHVKRAV